MFISITALKIAAELSLVAGVALVAVLGLVVRTVDRVNVRVAELEAELRADRAYRLRTGGPFGALSGRLDGPEHRRGLHSGVGGQDTGRPPARLPRRRD
jgi:hypothetical protein